MAWTTDPVVQAGNTTVAWTVSGGNLITNHDAVMIGPSGGSDVEITRILVRSTPVYTITVRVNGPSAATFRFYAEQIN